MEKYLSNGFYDYYLKLLANDKKIGKLFVYNLHLFDYLDQTLTNKDYLKDYKKKELKDIAIDFYNSIDKKFGKIVLKNIKNNNLIFMKELSSEEAGFSLYLPSINKNFAVVEKTKNKSEMLEVMVHELAHLIDYDYNNSLLNYRYNSFIEVISYTCELLLFDYLNKLKILPNKNELEKSYLIDLYLELIVLKTFLKKQKITDGVADLKIPKKYHYLLGKNISIPMDIVYNSSYGQSIAYLFLEQYQNDKDLMLYNFKTFIKNYFYHDEYENLNNYDLSLDQIKTNEPLKKALQKYY